MLSEKQVQRAFALYDSIKKLPLSRLEEGKKCAEQFLEDNKMKTTINPITALGKIKSKYKQECLKSLVENKEDMYNLYKHSYIRDCDIIHYLGIDKIKE